MNVWERIHQIKGILYGHCQNIILNVPASKLNESHRFKNSGLIGIEKIEFIDSSLLNFFEEIYLGEIKKYSYEYIQPNGFFFLYENDGIENGIRKPLHHLHVGMMKDYTNGGLLERLPEELIEHKGPHFKAPEMNFHEFMGIVVANFFSDHRDCEEMLRALQSIWTWREESSG